MHRFIHESEGYFFWKDPDILELPVTNITN